MQYVVIEERLMEILRKKWKDDTKKDKTRILCLQTSSLNVTFNIRQECSTDYIQLYLINN